jgi:hypothetical protein
MCHIAQSLPRSDSWALSSHLSSTPTCHLSDVALARGQLIREQDAAVRQRGRIASSAKYLWTEAHIPPSAWPLRLGIRKLCGGRRHRRRSPRRSWPHSSCRPNPTPHDRYGGTTSSPASIPSAAFPGFRHGLILFVHAAADPKRPYHVTIALVGDAPRGGIITRP